MPNLLLIKFMKGDGRGFAEGEVLREFRVRQKAQEHSGKASDGS
jgi:hypothetical protein